MPQPTEITQFIFGQPLSAVRDLGRRCALVRRGPGAHPMYRRPNGDGSRKQDRGRRVGRQPPVPGEIPGRPGVWMDLLEFAPRRRAPETRIGDVRYEFACTADRLLAERRTLG